MTVNTVIVTGAAYGIGRATVRRCLDDGMTVIACDIDEKRLNELTAEHAGAPLDLHVVDVASPRALESFFADVVAKHPDINGLVNNAGLYLGRSVFDYDDETIDRVIDVNVKAPVYLSRLFARHLLPRKVRGSIVNIASVAGEVGSSDALYGAAKAAVVGLTKSNAMNFAPYIRVNVVSPGVVFKTHIVDRIPEYRLKEYRRQETLDQDIQPEDVANAIAFLLGDQSRNTTGTLFPVDNGCYPR